MRAPVNPDFWKDKRVLLTGHTGFKGSWLAIWLQSMGARVHGFALAPPTSPALYQVARVEEGMVSHIGDIRSYDALLAAMADCRPDLIIHMAAQPLVRHGYAAPVDTFATNVMGTVHLLEAARHVGSAKAILNVTTDKCYENREWLWGYREEEPLGGYDPYSSSKACSELVTAAYRRSFLHEAGIAVATARAGNVIGGGDWASDRLVPDVLRALERNESVLVRNPDALRPWQHVLEPLTGYLMLAEGLYSDGAAFAEAWNFGPADEDTRPVRRIVHRLTEVWGGGTGWHHDGADHPHEAAHLKLDSSKARTRLGWAPAWNLDTALAHTVRWHRAWLDGADMRSVCLQQIQAHTQAFHAPHERPG